MIKMESALTVPPRGDVQVEVVSSKVDNDAYAIKVFLDTYKNKSRHTQRSYAKVCQRFLIWLMSTREPSPCLLPAVEVQDINDYLAFLSNPSQFSESFLNAHGLKNQPFRGPLARESMKHAITVLHKMFSALRELKGPGGQPYCMFTPTTLAHKGIAGKKKNDEIEEAMTELEWEAVLSTIEELPRETERDLKHYHRARWVIQLLYRTFLRRDEAAHLTMGSFEPSSAGWNIRVFGKGNTEITIVATHKLMEELKVYRTSLALPSLPYPGEVRPAILAVTGKDKGVSAQAIYLLCTEIFKRTAERLKDTDPRAAMRLNKASPHWMRHTGISHAMEAGVNPRYVQAQARHSSLNVTARYDHKARKAWRQDLDRV